MNEADHDHMIEIGEKLFEILTEALGMTEAGETARVRVLNIEVDQEITRLGSITKGALHAFEVWNAGKLYPWTIVARGEPVEGDWPTEMDLYLDVQSPDKPCGLYGGGDEIPDADPMPRNPMAKPRNWIARLRTTTPRDRFDVWRIKAHGLESYLSRMASQSEIDEYSHHVHIGNYLDVTRTDPNPY